MTKSLFRYIWRHSKRDQLIIFAVVIGSLPFFYLSLDLPRKIVNEAIQGHAFEGGRMTAPLLDLAIHWPNWLGGGETKLFGGFEVGRLELLYGLSFVFLFFVLVNGLIKYWINVQKGALGERMMRRLRFELFTYALRFTPEALRNVRSAEAATIIKDEVEPIGGFIGDAYIQPLMLSTQALTALGFILIQNVWLGILAAAVVGAQFLIIPRMRRELLVLGRQRQLASREFAGRVSEVIDGMEGVQVHKTGKWERAEIGGRLHTLFDIRFRIYKRKFIVKFLNNLLAQMTPFFFYAVGGYFALSGKLDIGQLVAVIAAYRELPPPLKELIDWDQQRLDVQVKYDQVVAYFSADKLESEDEPDGGWDEPLVGTLTIGGIQAFDANGVAVISGGGATLSLPGSIAILSDGTAAASVFARILALRDANRSGELKLGDHDLRGLGTSVSGRRIAYAGSEPVLFAGSIRHNLVYGLMREQLAPAPAAKGDAVRDSEAKRTGNPLETVEGEWVDHASAGAEDALELDANLIALLNKVGLGEDIYRFGLAGMIDPERQPGLAERIVEARHRFQELLHEKGMSEMVEPFDPERYNPHGTVLENLLFGVPTSPALKGRSIVEHPGFRRVLDEEELTDDLVRMGVAIAETMTDIFRDLPPGHPLFEQFSFVHADELAEFEEIVKRSGVKGRGGLTRDDRQRLLMLPLDYIEPKHRLGLIDEKMRERLLAARRKLRATLESYEEPGVEFYDPERVTESAPLRETLLHGRVNETIANARDLVRDVGQQVITEMDLLMEIERVGLDHQVGPAGRRLTARQRAAINLLRCVVKRPDILVVDGALAPFAERSLPDLIGILEEVTEGRTLVMVLSNDRNLDRFAEGLGFEDGRIAAIDTKASREGASEPPRRGSEEEGVAERDAGADAGDGEDDPTKPPRREAAE